MKTGIYKHYRGNLYKVIGMAKHYESLDDMVIYQALYEDNRIWVRPLVMFCETVLIGGDEKPRFEFVESILEDESYKID